MRKSILEQLIVMIFGWIPTIVGIKLRYFVYKKMFKNVKGVFSIGTGVTILGFDNIEIGKNVNIMKNSYIYAHDNGSLIIGDSFSMNSNVQLGAAYGRIVIKNNCSIGPNCVLRASNHNFDNPEIPFNQQGHTYGEIILEEDVWVASNSVITANTTIGKSSIIGAGSVVTKDVEAYSVMGGVPAKLIRKRK